MDHETMDYEKTGTFIQGLRIDKGMTQAQLADLLGISDRAVSKWETGKSFPDVSMLKPLAKILEVSVLELLDGQRQTEVSLSGEAAEDSFFKGLQLYLHMKDRRRRLYIALLALCLVVLCIGGIRNLADMREMAHQPTDLAGGNYSFTNIDFDFGDSAGEINQLVLDQPEDEFIKDAVKDLLAKGTADMKEVESLPVSKEAEQKGYVSIGGLVNVYPEGYVDKKSEACYIGDDAEELFEQLRSLILDYQTEKEGGYQYEGKQQYQYKDRTLTLACQPESKAEELVLEDFRRQLKRKSDTGFKDAHWQSSQIKSIRTKLPGNLTEEQSHDISKEIAYQELYDYRICEVLVKEAYTPSAKKLGERYSDGWHRYLYLLGKQPHETEFSICYTTEIHP